MGPDAAAIVGHLADPARRRVVAALVLGATTVEEIKAATGLATRPIATALARLADAELIIRDEVGAHWLVEEAFRLAAIAGAPPRAPDDPDAPPDAAKVLRAFVRDGRIVSIPTQHAKRRMLLDVLAQEFEPGRRYPERAVNTILRRWHEDIAALRRHLVDEELLDRDAGEYWRSGGPVPG
jgi:hypothetical protein